MIPLESLMLSHSKPLLKQECSSLFVNLCSCSPAFPLKIHMDGSAASGIVRSSSSCNGRITCFSRSRSRSRCSSLPPNHNNNNSGGGIDGSISLEEWQGWGTNSPVPSMVIDAIHYLKAFERENDILLSFGGNLGRLSGEFKVEEDKKHRATYDALAASDIKFQFYSARQIACRLLGSRGYLCQKCWLPHQDCMCSKLQPCALWRGIKFWIYMHPKDFLRQNNTGKLLWQVFGVQAATLCLFGVVEHEDLMWNDFKRAGNNKVWCLYPNKSGDPKTVKDHFSQAAPQAGHCAPGMTNSDDILHFILIDGTWNNSGAMFKRLKDRAKLVWGEDDIACISVTTGASAMHKLRPQPSWDRTCTAAAAAGLLSELQQLPQFSPYCLDKQGEILEDALESLLEALTTRRLRMGRSITRKMRVNTQIS
ncbi:uncharacterized protein LOC141599878 [Silene latifolia]|uniref:uncharacterized protein LOC141599878 n=1 Tax=Silene latifolia TaxID=37657 RepID=UPI003D77B3D9